VKKLYPEFIEGSESGQSLVEAAIIFPLLIFMMIGVFEVGWALRGYLVLININREAARFAVRPYYLNFDNAIDPGWSAVLTQALTSNGEQIDIDFDTKGTMVLTYIDVNTGDACNEFLDKTCDCLNVFTATIKTPMNYPTFTITYGPTQTTHFDYEQMAQELALNNRVHNCDLVQKGFAARGDGMIIAEMWFQQPMLLGFPLISNPLTDPVPMYAHSIFRRIEAVRGTGKETPTPSITQ